MQLYCPCCNEPDANILASIAEPGSFTCAECNADFTRAEVDELVQKLAKWTKVFAWAEKCPRDDAPAVKIA